MKIRFGKIFIIICVSVITGLVYNHYNPEGLKLIREQRKITWAIEPGLTEKQKDSSNFKIENQIKSNKDSVKKVSGSTTEVFFTEPKAIKIAFAYRLFNQGIKFIDARPAEEFAEGHIKGAVNIPFYGSENYENILNKISKTDYIVTYCNGDDCDLSILLGDELFKKGYKRVYVFFGGWNEWLKKGYPIED